MAIKQRQKRTIALRGNQRPAKRLDPIQQTYRTLGIRKAALPTVKTPPPVNQVEEEDTNLADQVFFSANDEIDDEDDDEDDDDYF